MESMIEQFAYGKLIENDRDTRGYTLVARSPNAPSDDKIAHIRAQAGIGQIYNLSAFAGADIFFTFGDHVVAGRLQRSPRQYERGYFLQEHYLVLPREAFTAVGNNSIYLHAALPVEIPWRTQVETLPPLSLPKRVWIDETQRVEGTLSKYSDQLFSALQLFLDQQPCIIIAPNNFDQAGPFFEALTLLLPLAVRTNLSWATGVMNARTCQARIKMIAPQASGLEGHISVCLDGKCATLPQASPPTHSYLNIARMYRDHFGGAELARAIEALPLADTSDSQLPVRLAEGLWRLIGASILERDLRTGTAPNIQMLFENLLPMLDQTGYQISPEQHSLFLVVLVQGTLNGALPIQEANRVPRDAERAQPESLWQGLESVLAPSVDARETNRWRVLTQWRQNKPFWESPRAQQFLYTILCRELDGLAEQPERALQRVRHWALNGWLPSDLRYHIDLLNRVSARGSFTPASLIAAWVDMITEPQAAMSIAQAVPPLATILHAADGKFTYISHALNRADASAINAMLAAKSGAEFEQSADLFLSLALMGERAGLTGLRAPPLIDALRTHASQLPTGRIKRLIALWEPHLTTLDSPTAQAIVDLMLVVGSVEGLGRLIAANWLWIDTPLAWLRANPISAPSYINVFGLVLDWFKRPLAQAPLERHKRLAEFFAFCVRQTNGTGPAVNELTLLMLCDALRGETLARETPGIAKLFRWGENELARRAARGIRAIREILFARGISPALWYRDALVQACQLAWTDRALIGKLISALKRESLAEEAQWIRAWNLQLRGAEILANLAATAQIVEERQNDLLGELEEAEEMTSQQVAAWMPDPSQRAALNQRLREISEDIDRLRIEIGRFQDKLH